MKVTLGEILSHGFPVPAPYHTAWTELIWALLSGAHNTPDLKIDRVGWIHTGSFPIDAARNEICRQFLDKDDGDYLLFVDADMVMPSDLAHRLAKHDLPIVTARYDMRRKPYHTVAMRKTGPGPRDYDAISKLERQQSGLIPIDAAGAGALLIRRDALVAIRQVVGDNWFQYQIGEKGLRDISEDMWFFEQARACGIQPYLDADVYSGHIAQVVIDPEFQAVYLAVYDMQRQQRAGV